MQGNLVISSYFMQPDFLWFYKKIIEKMLFKIQHIENKILLLWKIKIFVCKSIGIDGILGKQRNTYLIYE